MLPGNTWCDIHRVHMAIQHQGEAETGAVDDPGKIPVFINRDTVVSQTTHLFSNQFYGAFLVSRQRFGFHQRRKEMDHGIIVYGHLFFDLLQKLFYAPVYS